MLDGVSGAKAARPGLKARPMTGHKKRWPAYLWLDRMAKLQASTRAGDDSGTSLVAETSRVAERRLKPAAAQDWLPPTEQHSRNQTGRARSQNSALPPAGAGLNNLRLRRRAGKRGLGIRG
ncbi:hypothetical protein SBA4_2430001 [Candidatus Sulfopaludibacter sp. SbA4]|nr:hypothetical protein SBA4_2430001 [Candidatus Sulfopaludibacter sp. SbA4]